MESSKTDEDKVDKKSYLSFCFCSYCLLFVVRCLPRNFHSLFVARCLLSLFTLSVLFSGVEAQKRFAVILVPEQQLPEQELKSEHLDSDAEVSTFKERIILKIAEVFQSRFRVVDFSLAKFAFQAQSFRSPLNLSTVEAKNLGNAIGCDFYVLVKAETLLRTSLEKGTFYESYSAFFFVNTATGRLFLWRLLKAEAENPKSAEEKFFLQLNGFLTKAVTEIQLALDNDLKMQNATKFPEIPSENSPEGKEFKPPIPYRRIKPEYPLLASLYLVTATIDVAVDIDEKGEIVGTEILRWAGYGLEESVINTIKAMNWRPAERKGKPVTARVLLRYNFKRTGEENDRFR
jgi:hypothetical protein